MSQIVERIQEIKSTLPSGVDLIAVSKYHPASAVQEAYDGGHRIFGENRVQELISKSPLLPSDIQWHLIGTLQRNKVKYIVPFVHMIHSIDTPQLIEEVDRQCERLDRASIDVLLQVHISGEETKHGFSPEDLIAYLESGAHLELSHVRIVGLMAMASFTDDESKIRTEFGQMQEIFRGVKDKYFAASDSFCHLSIGMSDDYPIALEYGATYIRVGTKIFGAREY